jgi:hypothetical protein
MTTLRQKSTFLFTISKILCALVIEEKKNPRYCKRVYVHGGDTDDIYLTLLRIYLRPAVKSTEDLLTPALALIARNGPRLDPEATLQLLPPLVRAKDIRAFLIAALRAPVSDTKAVLNVSKARSESVARRLMYLESNRVKVTNTRMCVMGGSCNFFSFLIMLTDARNATNESDQA